MAKLGNSAEYDQYENTGFEPLPVGDYVVKVSASEVKAPKSDPKAEMIVLTADVLGGVGDTAGVKCAGRKLFLRFNTVHKNAQAQNIGRAQFKAFRVAAGKLAPKDTVELHGIPVVTCLKQRKGKESGELENELKHPFFKPVNKGPTPAQQAAATAAPPPWAGPVAGGDGAALMDNRPPMPATPEPVDTSCPF